VRLAIFALAITVATAPAQAQKEGPRIGHQAPGFDLERLDGGRAELDGLRGRPVIINFWASWCAPCRVEMPDLISAWREHSGQALQILAVNLTDQERRKDVTRFVTEFGLPFPVLLDTRGKVRELYALVSLPTTVFLDSAGIIQSVQSGPLTQNALAQGLQSILPLETPGPPTDSSREQR
jgi:cytochrome c biogenesis protein CcmG, thiol:disulfide interchange protein DsbE